MKLPAGLVTDRAALPVELFDWGLLQWLASERLSPGALLTVGFCELLPRARNPLHYHPNCEEVLYVISGVGEHSYDEERLTLRAGMTLRIPAGVRHNFCNLSEEPLVCLIAFSSGDRQTVFLE